MLIPEKKAFLRDAAEYSVVPVSKEIPADFETPLSLFLKSRGLFLLESIERGEHVGRFSIIACGRKCGITVTGRKVEVRGPNGNGRESVTEKSLPDPLEEVRRFFAGLKAPRYEHLPPFWGGGIGYLGYETVGYFENIPAAGADGPIPDACLVVPEMVLVYDSVKRSIFIIASVFPGQDPENDYAAAADRIGTMESLLAGPIPAQPRPVRKKRPVLRPDTDRDEFLRNVLTCQDLIRAGDAYQVVLSRAFSVDTDAHPFAVYRALRMINPSPYLFFLDFGAFALTGSSPEVMVRVQGREMLVKPLAGTRPRGGTVAEDDRLAKELLADAKEKAEHIMLVDLARNDLGRVARPGSVDVVDYMAVERYSHVMHLVSSVKAEMDESRDVFDVIRAVFPAGTLSGAPKIRAMEIISELEGRRRDFYGGMVFNLGFNGNFDSCITIRTILKKGRTAFFRAGAGIVADSVPENEFRETEHKAEALFAAIERAGAEGD
ncbi:MAG TPA: anthranilate synthase component I family protein [Candidatus Aminicenantes bacterium]|nr:anthranilate synthase component I family protein [Candidatus Aminicenantes bacterium]